MLEGSCECGAVRIELDETPADVTDCNHWAPADKRHPRMGVNMRMFPPEIVAPLKVVLCDAASWPG